MSKSYNNFIGLLDDEKTIRKRIKQIATDTIPVADPKDPDTCNVYNVIKHFLTEDECEALAGRYRAG
jgi:tryptophanyl-tRNA synthetase